MEKINLFIDGHVLDETNQGTSTFIRGLYLALAKKYPAVTVCIGICSRETVLKEVELFKYCKPVYYKAKNKYFRLLIDVPIIIRKYNIDYAHFQYFTPLVKNCKWIVTIHDLLFNDFPKEFPFFYKVIRNILFYISLFRSDIKTTVSEYSKKTIIRDFKIKESLINVIPNAVDPYFFINHQDKAMLKVVIKKYDLKNYILFVSRIEPRKNHIILARAFYDLQLDKKGYQLVFVGRKSIHVSELESFINSIPEDRRVCLRRLESIPNNELQYLYKGARLFIYPSKGEGFGIPPLEAAVTGIPTLCSNATAMKDYSFFDDCFFNPNDIEELKQKITDNLNRNDEVNIRRKKEIILNKYNWTKSATELMRLIEIESERSINENSNS